MKHSNLFRQYWWAALAGVLFLAMSCTSAPSAHAPGAAQSQAAVASSSGAQPSTSTPPPNTAAPKSDIWPKIYEDETYLTTFDSSWSEGEAVGAIKNLQNAMVEFNAGIPFSELDVDPYGLRAKWSWAEGSFIKSANLIIPFDQVSYLLLEHYPALDKEYKWGLLVGIANANPASLRTPTRDASERLGKAILVLAKARGAKVSLPNVRFGASLSPLSAAQAQAAGILQSGGIIISWVFKESPAEKAGFSPQDIITKADGKPVQKSDDLFSAIDEAAAAGKSQIKIDGIRRSYRIDNKMYIEIFVPVTFTLAIEQAGGAK
ncbi:MAG: PDZ domain-containing protein [Rectinema subterraneum]|uniref:PDZ domain-containing protein n=1 Tax=Rectinema subterraneum TaxID=2653714 RepID=UPI003C7BF45A